MSSNFVSIIHLISMGKVYHFVFTRFAFIILFISNNISYLFVNIFNIFCIIRKQLGNIVLIIFIFSNNVSDSLYTIAMLSSLDNKSKRLKS
uniref:Fowlpox virus genomic DNA, 11.2 kb-long BamHI-fragment with twenty open reading frames n=1 Tax=Fowlpox virus TaxID=10261 RepID=Q9YPJ5_FOWPV|nr:unnamed protein product [Fowlpox virus]